MSAQTKGVDVLAVLEGALGDLMFAQVQLGNTAIDTDVNEFAALISYLTELIESAVSVRDAIGGPDEVSVATYDRLAIAIALVQGGA